MEFLSRVWQGIRWFFRRFQVIRWLILIGLTVILVFSAWFTYKAKTADVQNIKSTLQTKTVIYDDNNEEAGTLYGQKGTYVELNDISKQVQNAVISTEDRTFYTNGGFSIKGILRSAFNYVIHHGQIMGGGSTITQQLAKNTLLTQKQTIMRKAQELFMAIQLNKVYSKQDILAMYLNNAYFGNGVWGVQDAAKRYFGKNASQLDASEGAILAGMLRNPSYYNPADHKDNAISRRNVVLQLMVDNNKLTQAQANAAKAQSVQVVDAFSTANAQKYPSYFDSVIEEARSEGISVDDILNKGYKIYTNLDQTYQQNLQTSFEQNWAFPADAADGKQVQGASIILDPKTGGVRAVVGNRGEHTFLGFNYATQLRNSPGSTIKPLMVYTPALENGYHYDSILKDEKLSYGKNQYTPTNATGTYLGTVPMYKALADSINAPAVWLLNKIGVQKGVSSLDRFGIQLKSSDQNLAAALGGLKNGVSPLMLARAYAAFANGGKLPTTHFIRKIVDATGQTVVDNSNPPSRQIISKKVAQEMTSMMIGTFNEGTGSTAKPSGYTIAGKTGSTEVPSSWGYGTKDQWVVGYTPDIVNATWIGYPTTDSQHFLQGTSTSGVAPLFKLEMSKLMPNTPQTAFDTKDAAQMASIQTPEKNDDIWQGIQDGIDKGIDSAKQTVGKWYDNIKGWFK
ncbi:PBP1A family penicillin-binding protein [Lacticaseibacillus casei]|jgi:penicillin-binding protein 2A|uniref:PBP1A family penicillin-binding protein n=1 Tax=Lacticaseibacillus huelsenbergensis TaxID=3035291 RepID=A0ABY8DT97_9LACO|nr:MULTISPECIES: PBP1A family penicillin-binding protein [Lacticaseibacillus]MDG3060531.1 PBP1A family penicillin-binding protein [Lacticaseibacillus sp. BCRC 81376]QVI37553.1 PBP1A family penicillin-binding protein [Lacticaseibacillus casei]QXG59340.1 PBP1A family penicillin-binding protein [Lacticaseibacillus casei]WFB39202.1 PBP1A family penicillin-binding protein [Lacticaseibacillus huelsenbergensis]WFB40904.1 PBP1A family penicillin-binding protein [Lacticaseibacillus huelsenbergensis]